MRILIVGAGAIGGMLAAYLSAAGRTVNLVARGVNAERIAQLGIRLTTPDQRVVHGRPAVVTPAATLAPHELVLITTKAFAHAEALAIAARAIGPATLVVPIANGIPWWFGTPAAPIRAIDPDGGLASAVPAERLVGSTIYSPAHRDDHGEWFQAVAGRLTLGPAVAGGDIDAAERVARAFDGCGYPAVVVPDVHRAVWSKLVTNAAFNPLAALTGARQADIARDPQLGPIALKIMREVEALAQRSGSTIDGSVEASFANARELGRHKPSMLQDIEAKRRIELAAIVDAPLELASRHGLPMPLLEAVGAAIRLKARTAGLL